MTGIIPNLSRAEYDAAPGIRSTALNHAARSLKHYELYKTKPEESTEDQRDGQLLHLLVLEPELFKKSVVIIPDDAPKKPTKTQINAKKPSAETLESVAWWAKFEAENKGRELITIEKSKQFDNILNAVHGDKQVQEILAKCSRRETAIFSRHQSTGLICKSLFDLFTDDESFVWDLKFVRDAEPEDYKRTILKWGYHIQAGHYVSHPSRLGKEQPGFGHIVLEKEEPYIVSVRPFDCITIEYGQMICEDLLTRIAKAESTGVYPGYHIKPLPTGLPDWKLQQFIKQN